MKRGQWMAYSLAVAGMLLTFYLALNLALDGHGWFAAGLGMSGVALLASQFLKQPLSKRKEYAGFCQGVFIQTAGKDLMPEHSCGGSHIEYMGDAWRVDSAGCIALLLWIANEKANAAVGAHPCKPTHRRTGLVRCRQNAQ